MFWTQVFAIVAAGYTLATVALMLIPPRTSNPLPFALIAVAWATLSAICGVIGA